MGEPQRKSRLENGESHALSAVRSLPVYSLKPAIGQHRKVRANPKSCLGNFFAGNDAVYHQNTSSNHLFYKEKSHPGALLNVGGRIHIGMWLKCSVSSSAPL